MRNADPFASGELLLHHRYEQGNPITCGAPHGCVTAVVREVRCRTCRAVLTSMGHTQPWRLSWRADPRALPLADRHYNRQRIGAAQFVPPGRCLVLLTDEADAVWVTSWPNAEYVQHAWAGAMVNSLFRREGGPLASELITAACAATRAHWPALPPLGIVSFVDPTKTHRKRDPGRCYRRAGWTHVGETAGGLLAFQLKPEDWPQQLPARPRYAHGQGDLLELALSATRPYPTGDSDD